MPYIKDDRDQLTPWYGGEYRGNELGRGATDAGEFTYQLSQVINDYLARHDPARRANFQDYCDVLGALTALQLEVYRRMVAPYEDTKIQSNGDVFDLDIILPEAARGTPS